jgi:hypothetical protein
MFKNNKKSKKSFIPNNKKNDLTKDELLKEKLISEASAIPTNGKPEEAALIKEAADMVDGLKKDDQAFDSFERKMIKDDDEIGKNNKDIQDTQKAVSGIDKKILDPIVKNEKDFFDPKITPEDESSKVIDEAKKKIDFKAVPEAVFDK